MHCDSIDHKSVTNASLSITLTLAEGRCVRHQLLVTFITSLLAVWGSHISSAALWSVCVCVCGHSLRPTLFLIKCQESQCTYCTVRCVAQTTVGLHAHTHSSWSDEAAVCHESNTVKGHPNIFNTWRTYYLKNYRQQLKNRTTEYGMSGGILC